MSNHILYLNVYAVTRHYGGPEEGGWWYNRGTPLAAVPFEAEIIIPPADADSEHFNDHGAGLYTTRALCLDPATGACEYGEPDDDECPRCEHPVHTLRYDTEHVARERTRLLAMFASTKEGNIYSVLGGVDVEVQIDEDMAATWPARRPHYE